MAAIVFPPPAHATSTPSLGIGAETFVLGSRASSAGQAITTVACAASGALTSAGIVNVADVRELTLFVAYDAHASTTTGRPSVLVLGSPVITEPAATDDVWYTLCSTDGVITERALDGALPANMDFTAVPTWGVITMTRLNLAPLAVSANSNKRRDWFPAIDVSAVRWIQILYGEMGDETNAGSLAISVMPTV